MSFGIHETEEEAARQYDRALIVEKGRLPRQISPSCCMRRRSPSLKWPLPNGKRIHERHQDMSLRSEQKVWRTPSKAKALVGDALMMLSDEGSAEQVHGRQVPITAQTNSLEAL